MADRFRPPNLRVSNKNASPIARNDMGAQPLSQRDPPSQSPLLSVSPCLRGEPFRFPPATRALTAELRNKVRENGLVLWLDADAQYNALVDNLPAAGFPYPVVALRGSYLELMLALEPFGNGLHKEHILVHLSGLNKETVKETPVYELYKAGSVYEKNLGTLAREAAVGIAAPDEVDEFLRAGSLALQTADQWLESLRSQPKDRLGITLESLGVEDTVMALICEDHRLRAYVENGGGPQILAYLQKSLGLDAAWRQFRIGDASLSPSTMSVLVAGWIMAVEFVHDLRALPVMPALQDIAKLGGPVQKLCRRLAARLREQHPDAYESFANEMQECLEQERTSHHAGELGSIDTFRFEEAATRAAAIGALCKGDWDAAASFAASRVPEKCFWVKRSPPLQREWEILRRAATTGQSLEKTKKALAGCTSLEEAVERYVDKLAEVDRNHRLFEQRAHALLASDLEDYDALLEVRQSIRQGWRTWADTLNRAFHELCLAYGPLPGRSLRQRSLYEDVVHPLVDQGKPVAYILVDALRFEMAQGLALELKKDRFRVTETARLAELPTDTPICMNALAPVEHNGRLRPVLKNGSIAGFMAREAQVCDPPGRVRAMSARSLGSTAEDFELEQFQDMSPTQLKRRLAGKPPLVIVRSREIDTAGEHGLHLGTFEQTLALLKSALSLLQQAGVERFVITSDHGFLLQDTTTENIPFGVHQRIPERRHALLREPSGMPDVLEVRLSALDYDVDPSQDGYLVFRPDTALWKTKSKIAPFAHGGNSLQERVIPVLLVERHVVKGKTTSKYEVVARPEPAHLGRQRLKVAVRLQNRENASLGFASPKAISLALRVPGHPNISISLLDAGPPATLADGRVHVPPNREEAVIEFELEGMADEKVRVEIFHPDAVEEVTPKLVEGFFDVGRNRRLGKPKGDSMPPSGASPKVPSVPPAPSVHPPAATTPPPAPTPAQSWADLISDEGFRKALQIVDERRCINELELEELLGSARRVRAFSRQIDDLLKLLPFEVEIVAQGALKVYARKD